MGQKLAFLRDSVHVLSPKRRSFIHMGRAPICQGVLQFGPMSSRIPNRLYTVVSLETLDIQATQSTT